VFCNLVSGFLGIVFTVNFFNPFYELIFLSVLGYVKLNLTTGY
jgi:hypothetical protein